MTTRSTTFSIGRSRGRHGSVVELLRHATTNSGISRVFTRNKSVPHLHSEAPNSVKASEITRVHDRDTEGSRESPLFVISPQYPPQDTGVELAALGISFPQPNPTSHHPVRLPAESGASVMSWVDFFLQSERDGELHRNGRSSVKKIKGFIDGVDAVLAGATSSTTIMDSDICSEESTPVNEDMAVNFDDLRLIGDDVVLKYILDGMGALEEPREPREIKEPPKGGGRCNIEGQLIDVSSSGVEQGGSIVPTVNGDGLLELRHRKDPLYEEPPSISLITATPKRSNAETYQFFPVPLHPSPPVTLPPPFNRNNPWQTKEICWKGSESLATGVVTVQSLASISTSNIQPHDSPTFGTMPNSLSEVEFTRSSAPRSDIMREDDLPNGYLPESRLGSILRKISRGLPSKFRTRHAVINAKSESLAEADHLKLGLK